MFALKFRSEVNDETPSQRYSIPYGIPITSQFYLPPDTSEHTLSEPERDRPVLDLLTPDGWKAELT